MHPSRCRTRRRIRGASVNRISFKGVLIGAVVDVVASQVLGIALTVAITVSLLAGGMPKAEVPAALVSSLQHGWPFMAMLTVGSGCSILGGNLAALIARRGELLNGALSAVLCMAIGLYTLTHGKSAGALIRDVVLFVLSPALGTLGGYLRLRTKRTGPSDSAVATAGAQ
jgi:hypothetical protein